MAVSTSSKINIWINTTGALIHSITFDTVPDQWNEVALETPLELSSGVSYTISANMTEGYTFDSNSSFDGVDYGGTYYKGTLNTFPNIYLSYFVTLNFAVLDEVNDYVAEESFLYETGLGSGSYRIKWLDDVPIDTNIEVKYKSNDVWVAVENDSVISVSNSLELKAILQTTDNTITPELTSIWVENVEVQNKISLIFGSGKFNNVVGNLTVEYNDSLGNLSGEDGKVESFNKTFLPSGLVAKENPRFREYIDASIDGVINLVEIIKIGISSREYIQASFDGQINLIYIDPVNP